MTTQEEIYDLAFEAGMLIGLRSAADRLMEYGLDFAASVVLNTPRPTRSETLLETEKQDASQAGTNTPTTAPAG
jgi:hypothetical protein